MTDAVKAELQALTSRAGVLEAQRQAALQRGDRQAVRDAEIELSRLHSRAQDIERQAACGL